MATLIEVVYLDKDNTIDLLLKTDGVAQILSAVTKMILEVGDKEIDSSESPTAFDWDTGTTGKVVIRIGDQGLSKGTYHARLTVIDSSNPNGIVWGDFQIVVK